MEEVGLVLNWAKRPQKQEGLQTAGRLKKRSFCAAQVHPQAGMRDREELKKAIEQTDRLLSRVRQLEGENSELCREKHDVFLQMRAVSLSARWH